MFSTFRSLFPTSSSGIEWLTLIAGLLMLGSFIAWTTIEERSAVEARERDRLTTQARVIDQHLQQQLGAVRRVLTNVRSALPPWRQQPAGMEQASMRLKAFSDALPGVRSLGIINAEGTLIAANTPFSANGENTYIGQNFSQRDYFQLSRHLADANLLLVSPPFSDATGTWVVALTMAVITQEGKFDGLVAATLDPEHFRGTLGAVLYAKDMWTAMAHGDGIQFMMVPERPGQAGKNLAQPGSFFTRHMQNGAKASLLTGIVYSTGEHRMMALRTIQPATLHMDKPLVIAVGRDIATIYDTWREEATIRAILFALLAATSILGLYTLQRHQLRADRDAAVAAAAIGKKNAELEALNEQLRALALLDGLTSVANRRRFDEAIESEWRRCRRDHVPLALLMIDIDHFKEFNDHYGHQAGDECLKSIAARLKAGLARAPDMVARYGGEEFACLLPECDLAGATTKAEELRAAIEQLNIHHEGAMAPQLVTISIGVAALTPDEHGHPRGLIADADEALYTAKRRGRNRICAAAQQMEASDND